MKPVSEVTALVIDTGLFVELALTLARTYKKVYYYCAWEGQFAEMNRAKIGFGLDQIEVVDSIFGPHFDEVDLFVFPDVYFGPLQVYLESIGKNVWGSRMGEELELKRVAAKELMAKLGLPVGPYRVLKGIEKLREYLKTHKNQWIKIDKYRGSFESFCARSFEEVEPRLVQIENDLGWFADTTEFIAEESLPDRVEIGLDAYTIDGHYPESLLTGIEIKDSYYIGVFRPFNSLPEPMRLSSETIAPTLRRYGYRGFISNEMRIGKDQLPYVIDWTTRAGSPPSELYQEFYENLGEIIWAGSQGELINPDPIGKFGAQCVIRSLWAETHWQSISFPEKYRRNIKLHNLVKIKGRYWVVPQNIGMIEVGYVIGWGDTQAEAVTMVEEVAESVSGDEIKIPVESADSAQAEIDELDKLGLNIFE